MREIMFRGKTLDNGEWVEGYLYEHEPPLVGIVPENYVPEPSKWFIVRTAFADWNLPRQIEFVEVDPSTVGQYTGLKDKNSKRIFEGDIVKTQPFSDRPYSQKAKYKQHVGVVKYEIRHFRNSLYEQDYEACWRVEIKDYGGYGCCDWSAFFKCEIIGNVTDNQELLEAHNE